jgi:hypothetical protein
LSFRLIFNPSTMHRLVPAAPGATSMGGLMEAAARRGEGSDYSLTEPRGKE